MTDKILAIVKEGLSAWKTFIATRQEAYNRKRDKNQEKAIQIAETTFTELFDFIQWVDDNTTIPGDKMKEFKKIKTRFTRLRTKFNKYD